MNTSEGTYVTAGNQLMALVDRSSFWIAAYFKETQLPHIEIGQRANLSLMGYKNQPFQGVVRSIGWGVFVQDGSGSVSTDLLPQISQTVDWVRRPQRFAVRIEPLGNSSACASPDRPNRFCGDDAGGGRARAGSAEKRAAALKP